MKTFVGNPDATKVFDTAGRRPRACRRDDEGHSLARGRHDPAGKLAEDAGGVFLKISDSVWDAMKHGTNMGLEHVYGAEPGSQEQLDHLNDASYQTAMVGDYERTSILREAGYPGTDAIPSDLLTSDGQMINVATVMNDDHLRQEYYDFMHDGANAGQGTLGHGASVYELAKNAAGRSDAAYQQAKGDSDGKSE